MQIVQIKHPVPGIRIFPDLSAQIHYRIEASLLARKCREFSSAYNRSDGTPCEARRAVRPLYWAAPRSSFSMVSRLPAEQVEIKCDET